MPQRPITGREKRREKTPSELPSAKSVVHNTHGGARAGAGNHHRIAQGVHSLKNEVLTLRAKYGVMPLDHMMQVLNADKPAKVQGEDTQAYLARLARHEARQDWASAAAAPFMHHKLASIEIVTSDQPVQHEVDLTKLDDKELDMLGKLVNKASKNPDAAMTLDESQYHEVE